MNGEYHPKRTPGPADFDAWMAGWRVFRAAMLMIGAATPSQIDEYLKGMERLVKWFPTPREWVSIKEADVQVRKQQWTFLYERARAGGPDAAYKEVWGMWGHVIEDSAFQYGNKGALGDWWHENLTHSLTVTTSNAPPPYTPPGFIHDPAPQQPGKRGGERATPKAPAAAQTQSSGWQPGACYNCGQVGHRWQQCGMTLIPPLQRQLEAERAKGNGKGQKGNGKGQKGNGKGQKGQKSRGGNNNNGNGNCQQQADAEAPAEVANGDAGEEAAPARPRGRRGGRRSQ